MTMEGMQQEQGLSPDRQARDLGIERIQELNIERGWNWPDIG